MNKITALLALVGASLAIPAHAETKEECKAMVEAAVAFCNKNPAEKCFEEINKGAQFKKGELFIFAFDYTGKSVANGGIASMIGKNMAGAKSADGQMFVQKQIEVAKAGSGWLEYDWMNPSTQKVQKKVSYVQKVNDSFYVGAGIHQ
jgi:signal transduction histidine kinase